MITGLVVYFIALLGFILDTLTLPVRLFTGQPGMLDVSDNFLWDIIENNE